MYLEFVPCAPGELSFFWLIDKIWLSHRPKHTIHRLCTLMRLMGAKTVVIERPGSKTRDWDRLRPEYRAMELRLKKRSIEIEALKLTFLACDVSSVAQLKKVPDSSFLGYFTVVNVDLGKNKYWSYIFESIVREPGRLDSRGIWRSQENYFLYVKREFECNVGNFHNYRIRGSYFCQQNSITHVCAHACASMMLTNTPIGRGIITAEKINSVLDFDHDDHKFAVDYTRLLNTPAEPIKENLPSGLVIDQLKKVFRAYNYEPYSFEFHNLNQKKRFRSNLYTFVESGFPSLLSFSPYIRHKDHPLEHVVAVMGHTLNPHSWLPLSLQAAMLNTDAGTETDTPHAKPKLKHKHSKHRALSSLGWVDDLIIHDENFGMQLCLPGHAFKPSRHPDCDINFTPRLGLGIFPQSYKVRMLGNDAEQLAIRAFSKLAKGSFLDDNYYTQRFLTLKGKDLKPNVVFRTLLVNWREYIQQTTGVLRADAANFIAKISSQHSHVWLVEVTEADLLVGNRAKVVDLILDASFQHLTERDGKTIVRPDSEFAILMVRMPDHTYARHKTGSKLEYLKGWPKERQRTRPLFCSAHA